jgi:hypothetical protein
MSDPVADAVQEEEKVVEEKVEEKKDATNTDVVNALKEVKEELRAKGDPAPSRQQIREALKEKTGFTDAQLDVVEQMNAAQASHSSKKVAELEAKVVWNDFEKEMGGKIDPVIDKIMKDELKNYDVSAQGDKVLLQKVYYMSLGIQADKEKKARKADPNANDKLTESEKVERRTIVETNRGSVQSLEQGGKKGGGNLADSLTEDEKAMSTRMGIKHEDYAKSKQSKIVGDHKPVATFRGSN